MKISDLSSVNPDKDYVWLIGLSDITYNNIGLYKKIVKT